jgi:methoxymalonate biosynthesis acyl carrier protein
MIPAFDRNSGGRADAMDDKAKIREFLSGFFQTSNLTDKDDVFALGLINSLFAMQLVLNIERQFNITVEDQDLDINNFNTIDNIAAFVSRKSPM